MLWGYFLVAIALLIPVAPILTNAIGMSLEVNVVELETELVMGVGIGAGCAAAVFLVAWVVVTITDMVKMRRS